MKNTTKGAIAGGAGLVLLAGGSTFALWSDTLNVNAGTVTAGVLTIDAAGSPAWRDISPEITPATIANISTFRLVPGDVIEYRQELTIGATGKNLRAVVDYDDTSVTSTGDLDDYADVSIALFQSDGTTPVSGATITAGGTYFAVVTIDFDDDGSITTDQGQGGTINLGALDITLTQTRTGL